MGLGVLMKELIKNLGPQVAKIAFLVVTEIIVNVGAEAAAKYLKKKYKVDIDKSVFEQAMRAVKR